MTLWCNAFQDLRTTDNAPHRSVTPLVIGVKILSTPSAGRPRAPIPLQSRRVYTPDTLRDGERFRVADFDPAGSIKTDTGKVIEAMNLLLWIRRHVAPLPGRYCRRLNGPLEEASLPTCNLSVAGRGRFFGVNYSPRPAQSATRGTNFSVPPSAGLSQRRIANELGINRETVGRYLRLSKPACFDADFAIFFLSFLLYNFQSGRERGTL